MLATKLLLEISKFQLFKSEYRIFHYFYTRVHFTNRFLLRFLRLMATICSLRFFLSLRRKGINARNSSIIQKEIPDIPLFLSPIVNIRAYSSIHIYSRSHFLPRPDSASAVRRRASITRIIRIAIEFAAMAVTAAAAAAVSI